MENLKNVRWCQNHCEHKSFNLATTLGKHSRRSLLCFAENCALDKNVGRHYRLSAFALYMRTRCEHVPLPRQHLHFLSAILMRICFSKNCIPRRPFSFALTSFNIRPGAGCARLSRLCTKSALCFVSANWWCPIESVIGPQGIANVSSQKTCLCTVGDETFRCIGQTTTFTCRGYYFPHLVSKARHQNFTRLSS